MIDLSDWTRTDMIASLSLGVAIVALLFSLASAGGTIWQAFVTSGMRKDAVMATEPRFQVERVSPFLEWAGWAVVDLQVTNPGLHAVLVESITVNPPGRGKIQQTHQLHQRTADDPHMRIKPEPSSAPSTLVIDRILQGGAQVSVSLCISTEPTWFERRFRYNSSRMADVECRISHTDQSKKAFKRTLRIALPATHAAVTTKTIV